MMARREASRGAMPSDVSRPVTTAALGARKKGRQTKSQGLAELSAGGVSDVSGCERRERNATWNRFPEPPAFRNRDLFSASPSPNPSQGGSDCDSA